MPLGLVVSLTVSTPCLFGGSTQAIALGGPGLLGGIINNTNPQHGSSGSSAVASFQTDMVLHSATNDPVPVSVNLLLGGDILSPVSGYGFTLSLNLGVFGNGETDVQDGAIWRTGGNISIPLPIGTPVLGAVGNGDDHAERAVRVQHGPGPLGGAARTPASCRSTTATR